MAYGISRRGNASQRKSNTMKFICEKEQLHCKLRMNFDNGPHASEDLSSGIWCYYKKLALLIFCGF